MRLYRYTLATVVLLLCSGVLSAYTIYLKDGSQLIAREKYTVSEGRAVIILETGTQTSIDLDEIDVPRTDAANERDYGGVTVLPDTSVQTIRAPKPKKERPTLSQVIQPSGSDRLEPSTDRAAAAAGTLAAPHRDFSTIRRTPYSKLDISNQLQQLLRSRGVEQMAIYQGSRADWILIDIVTNNEAAVFRAIEASAKAVTTLANQRPSDVAAFELYLQTDRRIRAGQFLLTPQVAAELNDGDLDAKEFFLRHVQF